MFSWMFIVLALILSGILFLFTVTWVFVPEFFGVYGYKQKTPIGKRHVKYIQFFPVFSLACLIIAWFSSPSSYLKYLVIFPFVYLLFLWVRRIDKDKRCFDSASDNLKYLQQTLVSDFSRWERFLNNESDIVFNYYCLCGDNESAKRISKHLDSNAQYSRIYLSGGRFVNKSWFARFYTRPASDIDVEWISTFLAEVVVSAWESGGEIGGWALTTQSAVDEQKRIDVVATSAVVTP